MKTSLDKPTTPNSSINGVERHTIETWMSLDSTAGLHQNIQKYTKIYQNIPKYYTKIYQNIPKYIPKYTKIYQNIPKYTKKYQKNTPKYTKIHQNKQKEMCQHIKHLWIKRNSIFLKSWHMGHYMKSYDSIFLFLATYHVWVGIFVALHFSLSQLSCYMCQKHFSVICWAIVLILHCYWYYIAIISFFILCSYSKRQRFPSTRESRYSCLVRPTQVVAVGATHPRWSLVLAMITLLLPKSRIGQSRGLGRERIWARMRGSPH